MSPCARFLACGNAAVAATAARCARRGPRATLRAKGHVSGLGPCFVRPPAPLETVQVDTSTLAVPVRLRILLGGRPLFPTAALAPGLAPMHRHGGVAAHVLLPRRTFQKQKKCVSVTAFSSILTCSNYSHCLSVGLPGEDTNRGGVRSRSSVVVLRIFPARARERRAKGRVRYSTTPFG